LNALFIEIRRADPVLSVVAVPRKGLRSPRYRIEITVLPGSILGALFAIAGFSHAIGGLRCKDKVFRPIQVRSKRKTFHDPTLGRKQRSQFLHEVINTSSLVDPWRFTIYPRRRHYPAVVVYAPYLLLFSLKGQKLSLSSQYNLRDIEGKKPTNSFGSESSCCHSTVAVALESELFVSVVESRKPQETRVNIITPRVSFLLRHSLGGHLPQATSPAFD
jgi:hypothetical protein